MPHGLKNFLKTLGMIFDGLELVRLVGSIIMFVFSFFPMIEEPYRWVEVTADQCPPSDSFSTSTPPAGRNGDDVSKRREHFVEGTVVRPKSLVLFLGFASIVVAVFQTGDWLLDIWNFFSHR